ncbi:MAG: TIGR02996 domain-containing protein [Fimbriiglobus sp.]
MLNDEERSWHRAIAAEPTADLPRLVFADWLEERGDVARAEFIRERIQTADALPWSKEGVRREYHSTPIPTSAIEGQPELHELAGSWDSRGFERGLPSWLRVREVSTFLDAATELFDIAPITSLSLPTANLQDWQRMTRQPWVRQLRRLEFYGISTPIEAIRAFCECPDFESLEEVVFQRTSGHAMPALLEDFANASIGRKVKSLVLTGGELDNDWVESLGFFGNRHALESFRLVRFHLHPHLSFSGFHHLSLWSRLIQLSMRMTRIPVNEFYKLVDNIPKSMKELDLDQSCYHPRMLGMTLRGPGDLRALDLSGADTHQGGPWKTATRIKNIQVLKMQKTAIPSWMLADMFQAPFWSRLVALDLANTQLHSETVQLLVDSPEMPELLALALPKSACTPAIEERFGHVLSIRPNQDHL